MGLPSTTLLSSLTWKVGVALFTAQLYPRDTEGYIPVCSELICWVLVLAIFELLPRMHGRPWSDTRTTVCTASPPLLSWMVAASIAVATLSSSVQDTAWITVSTILQSSCERRADIFLIACRYTDTGRSSWNLTTASSSPILSRIPPHNMAASGSSGVRLRTRAFSEY
jgi:hypothetical protein